MKGLVFVHTGDPLEVLSLSDVVEPVPKPGEVVVEEDVRPIHPADWSFVRGTYRTRPVIPQVAGLSGAGRIVLAGGADGLVPGTRVAFRWPGTWAERVAVPAERLILPPDVTDEDGAQLPLNPITAWGLLDMANVQPGQWLGLTAPASSVSQLVLALAEMRGVHAVPIEGPPDTNLTERLRSITGGAGLAAVFDSVGGPLLEAVFGGLQPGATILAYGTMSDEPIAVRNATLIYSNLSWRGFGVDRWLSSIDAVARERMLETLFEAMRTKRLPLPVRAQLPLATFREALGLSQDGSSGKVLLR